MHHPPFDVDNSGRLSQVAFRRRTILVRPCSSKLSAMKRYIFPLVLLMASMSAQRAYSQTQDIDRDWVCPTILVDCPETAGTVVRFTAKVSQGVPPAKFTFNWTVLGGQITSGQATSSISVASGFRGQPLTATVELGGIDRTCPNTASCSTKVGHRRKRRR